jgi:hypothetical protein
MRGGDRPVILIQFLFALIIASIVTSIFVFGLGRKGPWASFLIFFIVVLLASWAGGIWLTPVGPPLFGVHWASFLIVAFVFAILLVAAIPPRRPSTVELVEPGQKPAEEAVAGVLSVFFWILIGLLLFVIILRYV